MLRAWLQIDTPNFRLTFRHKFEYSNEEVYFAFCYPQSYTECQAQLRRLDNMHAYEKPAPALSLTADSAAAGGGGAGGGAGAGATTGSPVGVRSISPVTSPRRSSMARKGSSTSVRSRASTGPSDLYYHGELVNKSLDGRRVDLITVTTVVPSAVSGLPVTDAPLPIACCSSLPQMGYVKRGSLT